MSMCVRACMVRCVLICVHVCIYAHTSVFSTFILFKACWSKKTSLHFSPFLRQMYICTYNHNFKSASDENAIAT